MDNGILKELLRAIAWYINEPKTYNMYARVNKITRRAALEFAAYKKKQFSKTITLDFGNFPSITVLPNGSLHGIILGIVSASNRPIQRIYSTGTLSAVIYLPNTIHNDYTINFPKERKENEERKETYVIHAFIVGKIFIQTKQYHNFNFPSIIFPSAVSLRSLLKNVRLFCPSCPLCKSYHIFTSERFIYHSLCFEYNFSPYLRNSPFILKSYRRLIIAMSIIQYAKTCI